jgi:hypothetical protein
MAHCTDVPCAGVGGVSGDTSKCIAIHAEMNVVEQASASRRFPCTLYCSTTPCFECAKILITKGITRVVATSSYPNQQGADLLRQAGVALEVRVQTVKPVVVCLCGSTRFKTAFDTAYYAETMAGRIVHSVGFFVHSKHGESIGCTSEQKVALGELHKRKIDLSDEILVLNVGGYIGESTRSEIAYAMVHGKVIKYLEAV